jgi:hypothetical protein
MSARFLDAWLLIIGGAGLVAGFFARDLRNDVEMPMTDEELANKTPPTKLARTIYTLFCGGLFVYGLVDMFH